MSKKKILVTGANGYIGRYVVKNLLNMGHEVIVSDFNYDGIDERAKRTDISIFDAGEDVYEQLGQPDACVHLAWRNGFVHNHESHISDLPKHYHFLKNMIDGGLKQLVVMGSMHEVGYWEGEIDENTPTNPSSLYGIAKNSLRQMMMLLAKEKQVCLQWIRAYYIIGDDLKNSSIFTRITKMEMDGQATFPFTSGKNKFDFIRVEELARQIAAVVNQQEVQGIINCCTGKPVALADKVESFLKENHYKIRPEYGAFPDRPYDSPAIWGNTDKIDKILKQSEE